MDNNTLSDVPTVRLASGIEPQQKWPITVGPMSTQKHRSKESLKLVELNPSFGNEGTIVTVVVQALPLKMPVKLAFNSLMVDTKQLQAQEITSLVATVPSFQQIDSSTPNVPISVCYFDKEMVAETWVVAEFTYNLNEDSKESTTATLSTTTNSNKTSDSTTVTYQLDQNNDKNNAIMTNTFQTKDSTDFYQNIYSTASPYSFSGQVPGYQQYPYQNQQTSNHIDRRPKHTQTSQYSNNGHSAYNFFPSTDTGGFTGMLASGLDQTTTITTYTPTAAMSPMTPTFNNHKQQPAPARYKHRHNNGSAVFGFKSTSHTPTTSVANYQPYPGLVSRANLDIIGDLDSMTKNWSAEEWSHCRCLVQFWREQHSNKITTKFQPVPQGERATHSGNIVVSCIYWMERNDFFITSVDCIYLLECLMDIRFSVEEKNRIRRNLEGFRPLTVSKCKTDSAEFFKLIMSFPNPKPRNIEKDVKVFHWKTLPYALKKIITKYTASPYNNVGASQKINQQSNDISAGSFPPTPALSTPRMGGTLYQSCSSNYQTTSSYTHPLYDKISHFDQKPYQESETEHDEKHKDEDVTEIKPSAAAESS